MINRLCPMANTLSIPQLQKRKPKPCPTGSCGDTFVRTSQPSFEGAQRKFFKNVAQNRQARMRIFFETKKAADEIAQVKPQVSEELAKKSFYDSKLIDECLKLID